MNQPNPAEPATPPAQPPAVPPAPTAQAAATPPWGSAADFDPEKAWNLIQNLRGDVARQQARVAELTPYEQKVRELEDAQKSESQRLAEQLAVAQQEAAGLRAEALRQKVAAAKGVPVALVGRLQGSTEAELAADADALMAAFPQPAPAQQPVAQRTPVEALRPAALPNPPEPDLAALIAQAEKDGDFRTSIALKGQLLRQQPAGQ